MTPTLDSLRAACERNPENLLMCMYGDEIEKEYPHDPAERARRYHELVLLFPDDDTPRLWYASALDGMAGEVGCGECKGTGRINYQPANRYEDWSHRCPDCRGTGRVSNGHAERAEFCRVQCELARLEYRCGNGWNPESGFGFQKCECRWHVLSRRERELVAFADAAGGWFETCGLPAFLAGTPTYGDSACIVSRGFVGEVRCTMQAFWGGECERCGGHGKDYDYSGHFDDLPTCPACNGNPHSTGIAGTLQAAHPVTRWCISDREPRELPDGKFGWRPLTHQLEQCDIDFIKLEADISTCPDEWISDGGYSYRIFSSPELAKEWLGERCLAFAQREAARAPAREVSPSPIQDHSAVPSSS